MLRKMKTKKTKRMGFTLLELLFSIAIVGIMYAGVVSMKGPFEHRQQTEYSAVKLIGDLRQAQLFAYSQRDGYKYYGINFEYTLGPQNDREGWRLLRYNPPVGMDPRNQTGSDVNIYGNNTVIKSSKAAESPENLENTYFSEGVILNNTMSDFHTASYNHIVFTPEGSATRNGVDLVNDISGDSKVAIVLDLHGNKEIIQIEPLVGTVRKQ